MIFVFIDKENRNRGVDPLVHGLITLRGFTWALNLRHLNLETTYILSSKPLDIRTRKA